MTRLRKIVLGIAATATVAGGWMVLASRSAADARASAQLAAPPAELVAPGMIEAVGEKVELAFEQSGRVDEILPAEGDRVAAGALLARIDPRVARARVAAAEAALAAAEARRDAALRGARSGEIAAARADHDAAAARAWETRSAYARATKLRGADAISDADVENARGASDAAAAEDAAAAARSKLLEDGTRSELRREAVAAADAARAELELARALLAQTELRAPSDGTVLRLMVERGEQVTTTPPTVVLTMADTSSLQVRAEVDEADVARVSVGQTGYATAEAYGEQHFSGHVARVSSELGRKRVRTDDPRARVDTRILEVLFVLDAPEGLPLGMRMDVHL